MIEATNILISVFPDKDVHSANEESLEGLGRASSATKR